MASKKESILPAVLINDKLVCPICGKIPLKTEDYDSIPGRTGWVWFNKLCECGQLVRLERKL